MMNGSFESSSNGSVKLPPLDANVLRYALRLIHCMQIERGASCAFCSASEQIDDRYTYSTAMISARSDTDIAIRLFRQQHSIGFSNDGSSHKNRDPISAVSRTLKKVRNLIDRNVSACGDSDSGSDEAKNDSQHPRSALGFHRILIMFSTLVSNVQDEYVLKHDSDPIQNFQKRQQRQRNHRRMPSSPGPGINKIFPPVSHMGSLPTTLGTPKSLHTSSPPKGLKPSGSHSNILDLLAQGVSPARMMPSPSSFHRVAFECHQNQPYPPEAPQQTRTEALMDLLGSFVRLKESTGRERAILFSIMATDQSNMQKILQHRLMNDLVLEVENQRKILHAMQSVQVKKASLFTLVQDCVRYGPEMEALQDKIIRDFDLVGFRSELDDEEFWQFISIYIDKLHSLELLIIEEIECSGEAFNLASQQNLNMNNSFDLEVLQKVIEPASMGGLKQALEGKKEVGPEELCQQLENMPAELFKSKMIGWLQARDRNSIAEMINRESTPTPPPPPPPLHPGTPDGKINDAEAIEKEWEINLYELQFQRRIGRGSAATTYMANWTEQKVAVKVASITEFGLDGWRAEVQMLSKLHHPNIIRLLGSVYNESPLTYCLVLEYCDAGDLESALRRPAPKNFFFHVSKSLSNGMAYLHSRGVLHRDLKPGNVLLHGNVRSGDFAVKVTDFGVATEIDAEERTAETGTYRWMAPEVIRHEPYAEMADVYSFACLMWQLITREEPFEGLSQIEAAGKVALEKSRPPFPNGTPADVLKLIDVNWSDNPAARQPFELLSKHLKDTESSLKENETKWIEDAIGHPVYRTNDDDPQEGDVQQSMPPMVPPNIKRRSIMKKDKGAAGKQSFRNIFPFMKKTTL